MYDNLLKFAVLILCFVGGGTGPVVHNIEGAFSDPEDVEHVGISIRSSYKIERAESKWGEAKISPRI